MRCLVKKSALVPQFCTILVLISIPFLVKCQHYFCVLCVFGSALRLGVELASDFTVTLKVFVVIGD